MCGFVQWVCGVIGEFFKSSPSKPPLWGGFSDAHGQLIEIVFNDWNSTKNDVEDIKFGLTQKNRSLSQRRGRMKMRLLNSEQKHEECDATIVY